MFSCWLIFSYWVIFSYWLLHEAALCTSTKKCNHRIFFEVRNAIYWVMTKFHLSFFSTIFCILPFIIFRKKNRSYSKWYDFFTLFTIFQAIQCFWWYSWITNLTVIWKISAMYARIMLVQRVNWLPNFY